MDQSRQKRGRGAVVSHWHQGHGGKEQLRGRESQMVELFFFQKGMEQLSSQARPGDQSTKGKGQYDTEKYGASGARNGGLPWGQLDPNWGSKGGVSHFIQSWLV